MIKYVLILSALVFFSCKKAQDRKCFKGTGEEDVRMVTTDLTIDTLYLYDNLYYSLEQSNATKVELKGGENLLQHIEVRFEKGRLTIKDNNKCDFLRSYKHKLYAKIYVDSISYIHYEGGKELKSSDTLRSNELRLMIRDGAGSTDLTLLNGYTSATVTHGFGDFTLRGKTSYAYLFCNTNSFCDTRFFTAANDLKINSNTVGKMKVNANTSNFNVIIQKSGNVEYIGYPDQINLERSGNGELVSLNN